MDLSRQAARAIAEAGYVFLLPLVTNYGVMYAEAIDTSSPAFGGGFGRWTHRRHAVSHESDVGTKHLATLDSSAWLDVRAEPWVLSIPPVGDDRTTVVTDLWSVVVDESGGPGSDDRPVVVAGDAWVGADPCDAVRVVRTECSFVRCETWARTSEPANLESMRDIRDTYWMEPLSTWTNTPPPPAPAIAWWPIEAATIIGMAFWPAAAFALDLTTRNDQDRRILDKLAEIGVVPGARWDEHDLPADLIDAIDAGMNDALTNLMRAAETGDHTPTHRPRPDADRDHFSRALATLRTIPPVGPYEKPGPRP